MSHLAPGQSCVFHAALENVGDSSVSLTEKVTISQPATCRYFQYSDNVPVSPPAVVAPAHTFSFVGTLALALSAGNACQGALASVEVTITGTESLPALAPPAISVSPTTINSGQSSTLFTTSSFSGGVSPYTCQWLVEAPGHAGYGDLGGPFSCSAGSKPTVGTGSLTTPGTWQFELEVTDSAATTTTSNAVSVTVIPAYSVTFSESGLPAGLTWKVTVNGITLSLCTTGGTGSLTWTGLSSGSYSYSIAGNPGWHQNTLPYNGHVVVSGASLTEPTLRYSQVTYSVTFTETGLPTGMSWSVTLNGVTESSTGASITFAEPNGTYIYSIGTVSGCGRSPSLGTVTVNGAAVSVTVKITKV